MKKTKKGKRNSVQELLGIQRFTRYGLLTDLGELVFFRVAPTNISVLSRVNIENKISHLKDLLSVEPDTEIICTDSCECFDDNREYLRRRAMEESNPKVRKLLEQDRKMLTQMQAEMANAREFFFVKTDPQGFYIGRDKFGTNILVDLDRRADDKTTGSALILGNSGAGKSYLLKLLLTNLREAGKTIIALDAEGELKTLAENNGGCYLDYLDGDFMSNILEPKVWSSEPLQDPDAPEAFRRSGRIAQHIAFLKDWFRSYKDFTDAEVDTIEIMLSRLYEKFGLTDTTDYSKLKPTDYPILEDLFEICVGEYRNFKANEKQLYTEENLQRICLGLNSMCVGSESRFFNGHTNIQDDKFLVFGVKGIMDLNKKLRCAIEFNILSYMTHQLLCVGNCVAALDELYLFLDSPTTIEYIRNAMKRVRKMDSSLVLASQNIEDFLIPSIREFTKPLFAIPTHQFLFNPGSINPKEYMESLQVGEAEYELIHSALRGTCLFRCGNERYLLQVIAPDHKSKLFGTAGGR